VKNLYPPVKPRTSWCFPVTDGYKLYYELVGNPKGIPTVFLHGGPGAGFEKDDRRFFNPKKFNVLLFDQRGSGKSKPFASTKNNTTQKLIQDIQVLTRHFFGDRKVFVFGGSWGSTLALAYSLACPKNVLGILLRAVFLANSEDNADFFGGGTRLQYPDVWERFIGNVPPTKRKNWRTIIAFFETKFRSKKASVRKKFSSEWSRFEMSMLKVNYDPKGIEKKCREKRTLALAALEAHYIGKLCFMPDNYLIDNAHKLSSIPATIVHGRHDKICRPINAWRVHKAIKGSKLVFVNSAHSAHDENMERQLREEMDIFAKKLSRASQLSPLLSA
jgi:proline iminopeptidase